jgi:succinate dehydrogenase / fumarate reductase cytochrome b subunit
MLRFFHSTVGLKFVMAVTGALLFLFLIAHMTGNWLIFAGSDAMNSYAFFLKSKPAVLWGFRLGLLVVVALHIYSAITLTIRNRAARPRDYEQKDAAGASLASRTMMVSGIIVLAFIIFHLLHFTVGWIQPEYFALRDEERHDVFGMVVNGFRVPWVAGIYIGSMALVGFHLSHGLMSMFRSLGLSSPAYRRAQELFAMVFAAFIFVGMAVIPAAIVFGLYPRPGGLTGVLP